MAATLDLHKTLAALRPDPPPRPLRIMLIATSSKLGGLAVTGAQNFYDVTTAGAEAVGQPWSQPVEGWHKEFYTAANVTANGHAYGPLALEGVLRKQLDELSPKVTLRMDYDLTGVRLDDKGSLASVSIKQMLAWRAEAPKHREFDPNMMTEVYHAAIYIDASETGRLAHLALSAKGGANKYTWGRQERWRSNSWQDGIHPLAPDYNPAEDKVQMAATLMFQASRWSG